MAIKSTKILDQNKRRIDLRGPLGNAHYLLGLAQDLCKQLGRDPRPLLKEMRSSDYDNLIKVFDREFGDIYDLYR